MKASEVRDLTGEEQAQKLAETEKELFNLRIQQAAGQLEKPDRLRTIRHDIAHIKTIMNTTKTTK